MTFRHHFPKTLVLKSKVVRGIISSYTRGYQLIPEINGNIQLNDGELLITGFPGFPDQRLFAINENEFSLMGSYYEFSFLRNDQGKVTGIRVQSPDNRIDTVQKLN